MPTFHWRDFQKRRTLLVGAVIFGVLTLLVLLVTQSLAQPGRVTMSGTLSVILGDGETGEASSVRYFLTTDDGQQFALEPGDTADYDLMSRYLQPVEVSGRLMNALDVLPEDSSSAETLSVDRIRPLATGRAASANPVIGSSAWVSIACKFSDVSSEQHAVSYLADMYTDSSPGLDAYWREASYNQLNLDGSTAVGWYEMPQPRSYYLNSDQNPRLQELFHDCASQAIGDITLDAFDGVNLILNGNIGCCAWGGGVVSDIGGSQRTYRVTWLPPWAWTKLGLVEHEMGHGFGLPHSSANDYEYGNTWDVMSDTSYYCAFTDAAYGCAGKHTIAYHKDLLGWIPANRIYVADAGTHHVTLEQTTQPGPNGDLLVKVPVNGSADHFVTIEARRRVGYDAGLPGNAIVLHDVQPRAEPAHLIDPSNSFLGAGDWAMWEPGESFAIEEGNILIRIDKATATGFEVTIVNGAEERTVLLGPTDDTYVREELPYNTYGSLDLLRVAQVGSHTETYLKFDPALVPDAPFEFKLQMTVDGGTTDIPGTLYQIPLTYEDNPLQLWTEAALSWANKPHAASAYGTRAKQPQVSGNRISWDITAAWYGYDAGIDAISIKPESQSAIRYMSKESGKGPQLAVKYLVEPGAPTLTPTPSPPPTLTPTPSLTPTQTNTPPPVNTPTITTTPGATKTAKPTSTPRPTKTPKVSPTPSATVDPSATATPLPPPQTVTPGAPTPTPPPAPTAVTEPAYRILVPVLLP
ncbi:MAG: DNRLRE domain-containing protein [Chloroflexota bacterium]